MSASNTDLVRQAAPNFATTLNGAMLVGDTTMTLTTVTGLSVTTGVTIIVDATDPTTGLATPTLKEVMTGVVSGSTVTNLVRGLDGTTQQAHANSANVVMWITANLWNDFQAAFLVGHTQLGAHSSGLALTSTTLTTPIIASGGAPASASAAGTAGTIAWDTSYIYICTATNTWKRVAIATW